MYSEVGEDEKRVIFLCCSIITDVVIGKGMRHSLQYSSIRNEQ